LGSRRKKVNEAMRRQTRRGEEARELLGFAA
jgi:hypothetical protein